jgi:hypothetical protein
VSGGNRDTAKPVTLVVHQRQESMMLFYFECSECGYDSDEAKQLVVQDVVNKKPICPLCAGDSGHRNRLAFRQATDEETKRLRP